jgi:presenilin-like A22 family membrane protease
MESKKMKLVLLSIICLCAITSFSQDLPADFDDVLDDNPTDATLDYLWGAVLFVLVIVYLSRKKWILKDH